MTRAPRIDWTAQELDKLFAAAQPLWAKDKALSMVALIGLAQSIVLPENRRRAHLKSPEHIPLLLRSKLLEAGMGRVTARAKVAGAAPLTKSKDELRIEQLAAERDEARDEVNDLTQELSRLKAENETLRTALKSVPSEMDVVKRFVVDILADVQARGKAITGPSGVNMLDVGRVVAAAAETTTGGSSAPSRHDPEPKSEERPRLPKILVCGLRDHQRAFLESRYKDRARLSFWVMDKANHGGAGYQQLREKAKHADLVVCSVEAMDHQSVGHVKEVANGRFRRCTGSQSEVSDTISAWFLQRTMHQQV